MTIERNLVHDADIGIEAASEVSGHVASAVTIRDNLVYDTGLVDITIGGYDATVGGSDSITIVDNTLYQSASAQGNGFQVQYKATNNVFKNNIVALANTGTSFLYDFTSLKAAPVAMDYNLYYASAANPSWVWKNKNYSSLASFASASTGCPFEVRGSAVREPGRPRLPRAGHFAGRGRRHQPRCRRGGRGRLRGQPAGRQRDRHRRLRAIVPAPGPFARSPARHFAAIASTWMRSSTAMLKP